MQIEYSLKTVTPSDLDEWLELAYQLWPDHDRTELRSVFRDILTSSTETAMICRTTDGTAVAFVNVSMRQDYVEGSARSPVGYMEGIFVDPEFRKAGIARRLVEQAEQWAHSQGAQEMGSDTEVVNQTSQQFHRAIGFGDAGTIVHFIKKIG